MSNSRNTSFDRAQGALFSSIHRCRVLDAAPAEQDTWLRETVEYLGESFPTLTDRELNDLREIGERFCQPAIPHGKKHTELNRDEWQDEPVAEETEATAAS